LTKQFWNGVIFLLIAIILIGVVIIWSKYTPAQPIEISISPTQKFQGEVYVGGAVTNPGIYPVREGDSLDDIIRAAGGTTDSADLTRLEIYIPIAGEPERTQKIDINRAEAWLLQALPGIGETRAQAIVEYRKKNGRFASIDDLTKVDGIGQATYDKIKHLITVAD